MSLAQVIGTGRRKRRHQGYGSIDALIADYWTVGSGHSDPPELFVAEEVTAADEVIIRCT